jgi:hypothetical protein
VHVFSALCVPCEQWNSVFDRLKLWRRHLRDVHGIPLEYELHAQKFLSGRGSVGALGALSRHRRAQIFHRSFQVTNWLSHCGGTLFNVCHAGDDQFRSFERLLNRINATMRTRDDSAILYATRERKVNILSLLEKCASTTLFRASSVLGRMGK